MKKHTSLTSCLAAVAALLWLTSCGDIQQDLVIQPNGSGRLETTFDLGEMMSMVKGFGEITPEDMEPVMEDEDQDRIAETAPEEPEEPKDPMEAIMDRITDPAFAHDFDTLIAFKDIMPDSVREAETRMDLVERMQLRLTSPANSANLTFGVVMNFDSPAHLKEMVTYLEEMDKNQDALVPDAGAGSLQSESFLAFEADMKAGWIRFDDVDYSNMSAEFGMESDSTSAEEAGMMEMMFGSSKIKTVIHVPGEVTSCTNPDAILTKDNKVIVEHGLMDVVRKKSIPGYTIYFTPK